ncbi:MAG: isoprenylcysteine carboxylmethyltransferase family protein [Verrucomicrobiae bacterium]|nr:isoprenylcysteine carboxylmethyltransferase family protein [Verrucomicrobiae bacterium]
MSERAAAIHGGLASILWIGAGGGTCAAVVFGALLAGWTCCESKSQSQRNDHCSPRHLVREMLYGTSLLGLVIVCAITQQLRWAIAMPGTLLFMIGTQLRAEAIRQLATDFHNTVKLSPCQELKTIGIYRYLRHPSETGNLCIAAGLAMFSGSACSAFFFLLAILPQTLLRVQAEDTLLGEAFGKDFINYSHQTPALLPWFTKPKF